MIRGYLGKPHIFTLLLSEFSLNTYIYVFNETH